MTFANNRISGNTVRNQVALAPYYGSRNVPAVTIDYLGAAPRTVSGNTVQGNDLGAGLAPILLPADGFIDGGGNVCQSGTYNPLGCLAPSGRIIRRR